MKKFVIAFVVLISLNAFSQKEDVYTKNVKKAIALYNGEQTLDNIAKDLLAKLPEAKKNNPTLQQNITAAKDKAYNEAVIRMRDKFSGNQINEIIKDLSVKKESYSGITNSFIRQWGINKRKYLVEISDIYKKQ